jgi:hypothetical protein
LGDRRDAHDPAFEAGLNREQLKAALKYASEQKWIADSNKAAWYIVKQAGFDSANPR